MQRYTFPLFSTFALFSGRRMCLCEGIETSLKKAILLPCWSYEMQTHREFMGLRRKGIRSWLVRAIFFQQQLFIGEKTSSRKGSKAAIRLGSIMCSTTLPKEGVMMVLCLHHTDCCHTERECEREQWVDHVQTKFYRLSYHIM